MRMTNKISISIDRGLKAWADREIKREARFNHVPINFSGYVSRLIVADRRSRKASGKVSEAL